VSPNYLLTIWRERWARQREGELDRLFSNDIVAKWLNKLPESSWASRAFNIGSIILLSAFFQWFALQVVFSLNGQITYSTILVSVLILLRRMTGNFIGFFIWVITLNVSFQYFYWRLTKTLVFRSDLELLLSLLLCIFELSIVIFWLIQATQTEEKTQGHWPRTLGKVANFLHFYSPLLVFVCLLLPGLVFLGRLQVISGPIEWWLPLVLPVWLFFGAIQERRYSVRRKSFLMAIREGFLASYLFLRTIFSFLNASRRHPSLFFKYSFFGGLGVFRFHKILWSLSSLGFVVFNTAAFFAGLIKLVEQGVKLDTLLLTGLSLFNLGLLFGRWAVSHETQHVRIFLEKVRVQSLVLKVSSGRTLVTKIVNFPSDNLKIAVPATSSVLDEINRDQTLVLQISHADDSFNLTAQAVDKEAGFLLVQIAPSSSNDWKKLSSQLLARPADWPGWLPKRDADQILPIWLSQKLHAIPAWIVDSLTKLAGLMKLETLTAFLKARIAK
jgi:hypothetical protein